MRSMVNQVDEAIHRIRTMSDEEFLALYKQKGIEEETSLVRTSVPTEPLKHMSAESSGRFEGGFVVAGRKSMSTDSASEKFTSIAEWTEAA